MANRVSRTYKFDDQLIDRLTAQARRLHVFPGPLLELLIARALDEIEAGRWRVDARPVAFRPAWPDEP